MKNLKTTLVIALVFATFSTLSAQAYTGKGDKKLNLGLDLYGYGTGITGTFDYGIHEVFSVGAGAEFYFDNDGSDPNFYVFGRADAHLGELLDMPSEMDLYPGIDLGVAGDDLGIGGHIGFRYFFNTNIGAYVEIGSRGSLGVSINL